MKSMSKRKKDTASPQSDRTEIAAQLRQLADSLNIELETMNGRSERAQAGQFTTPSEAAATIVDLLDLNVGEELKVVDPGAGSGALMLSLAASVIEQGPCCRSLAIDAIEQDSNALELLKTAADAAEKAAGAFDIKVQIRIVDADFLDLHSWAPTRYDIAILNPPYMKLGQKSDTRLATRRAVGIDCPNLYASFMATALHLVKDGGQIAAITPRSFANGRYFREFRHYLTSVSTFRRVVLFDRRDSIFKSSSVLQETVIFRLDKVAPTADSLVLVETRSDHLSEPHESNELVLERIVSETDADRFINLPGNKATLLAAERIRKMPQTLESLGLSVSTGPVVDFRLKPFLAASDEANIVPLLYPLNARSGEVNWPVDGKKPQGFRLTAESKRHVYPNGHYVVLKRFTAKEEKRRIVASVYSPVDGHDFVAFENHLNVVHRDRGPISLEAAVEIADFLNSDDIDIFFRMFSGNTQVNATDLRRLPFPNLGKKAKRAEAALQQAEPHQLTLAVTA